MGNRRVTGGRPAAARIALVISLAGRGSPWLMKYALPAQADPGASRSPAARCASAALSTYTVSMSLSLLPMYRIRPDRARSSNRGIS